MVISCRYLDLPALGYTEQKCNYPPGNNMPATSENVLFPGDNHLLTTGTDDPTL